ncbi:hypothetical protein QF035_009464 [Streptomyces umbrinus]|uniref:Transposase n=1 Tax=Streptomyces umbrinus TaxID=67370 RepID=A0ABU0T8K1_9ACTN|nr:hypothetical protein [Streptomyces umbrinus]
MWRLGYVEAELVNSLRRRRHPVAARGSDDEFDRTRVVTCVTAMAVGDITQQ